MRISDWSSDVCSSDLVYLVFNTIGNVETQDRQVACFANAAAHLEPVGAFVIELVVPDLRRLVPGHDAVVFAHGPGYVGYDRYDEVVAQRDVSHHFIDDWFGACDFCEIGRAEVLTAVTHTYHVFPLLF